MGLLHDDEVKPPNCHSDCQGNLAVLFPWLGWQSITCWARDEILIIASVLFPIYFPPNTGVCKL